MEWVDVATQLVAVEAGEAPRLVADPMTADRKGPRDLAQAVDRLAGLLAGAAELDWPGVIHAACDEIEDLRGARVLPGPLVGWVRSVIGRWPR